MEQNSWWCFTSHSLGARQASLKITIPFHQNSNSVENPWRTMTCRSMGKKKPLSRYIPSFRNKAILKIELGMGAGQNCRNSKLVNTFQTSSILVNKNPTPPRPTAKEQDLNPFSTALGWTWHLLEDRGEVEHQEQVNGNTVFLLFYTA